MGDEAAADAATVAMNWRRVFMGRKCLGSKVEGRSVAPCLQGVGAIIVHKALSFQIKAECLAEDEFVVAGEAEAIGLAGVLDENFPGPGGDVVEYQLGAVRRSCRKPQMPVPSSATIMQSPRLPEK